ncbi:putative membrane-associated kinase regulator 1 [Sesbania bispinosa]|nr:putative membrane-associated kinase regulator 1 [Sesbania bispinosa]
MVRTLLLSSSTSSTTSSAARDSTGSTSSSNDSSFASDLALFPDCDSSRPSSVTNDDDFKRINDNNVFPLNTNVKKRFSFSRFSSVFRRDNPKTRNPESVSVSASSVKRMSNTAKEVFRKYLKKVKPLYEMLSQKQPQQSTVSSTKTERSAKETEVFGKVGGARKETESVISHSFSGNLRYPLRRKTCVSSCPSSMRSSPTHSGVLSRGGFAGAGGRVAGGMCYGDASTMEELQSAIQGAIAHCKNSLTQNKTTVSDEF